MQQTPRREETVAAGSKGPAVGELHLAFEVRIETLVLQAYGDIDLRCVSEDPSATGK